MFLLLLSFFFFFGGGEGLIIKILWCIKLMALHLSAGLNHL